MAEASTSVDPTIQFSDPVVRRGQEAWSRLATREKHTWEDWLAVGEALRIGRHGAMLEAGTNKPSGSRYADIFGQWLKTTNFDAIEKGTRSRLFGCLDHRDDIERWREALPLSRRLELNHPNSVWRNWSATVTDKGAAEKTTQLSPIAKLKQEVVRLEDENLQLRRAGDDLFSARDSAADIARLLADRLLQRLSPDKVQRIIEELPRIVAERGDLPRDAMKAKKRRRTLEDFQADVRAKRTSAEAEGGAR
jgi:hypothetical protein